MHSGCGESERRISQHDSKDASPTAIEDRRGTLAVPPSGGKVEPRVGLLRPGPTLEGQRSRRPSLVRLRRPKPLTKKWISLVGGHAPGRGGSATGRNDAVR